MLSASRRNFDTRRQFLRTQIKRGSHNRRRWPSIIICDIEHSKIWVILYEQILLRTKPDTAYLQRLQARNSWNKTVLNTLLLGRSLLIGHRKQWRDSSNCFSIVWGQENAPLVTSLPSSYYMTLNKSENARKNIWPVYLQTVRPSVHTRRKQ